MKYATDALLLAPSSKMFSNYLADIFANTLSAEMRDVLLGTMFLPSADRSPRV
jgi:hypothetical protein